MITTQFCSGQNNTVNVLLLASILHSFIGIKGALKDTDRQIDILPLHSDLKD